MEYNNSSEESQLTIAWNGYRMVHVDDVPRGKACKCVCANCKQPVMAVKGEKNMHHFRHYDENGNKVATCNEALMTALHKMAEQIICDAKCVMLPVYYEIEPKLIHFKKVEVEERNDRKDLQPDIVGVSLDDDRYLIEIKKSSGITLEKENKIKESNLFCLEIDVNDFKTETKEDIDSLKKFLLEDCSRRTWINNPKYEEIHNEYIESYIKNLRQQKEFDAKLIDNCRTKCGFHGDCLYYFEEIIYKGKKYRLCTYYKNRKKTEPENNKSHNNRNKKPTSNLIQTSDPFDELIDILPCSSFPQEPTIVESNLKDYYLKLEMNLPFYVDNSIIYALANYCEGKDCFFAVVVNRNYENKKGIWGVIMITCSGGFSYKKRMGLDTELEAIEYINSIKSNQGMKQEG